MSGDRLPRSTRLAELLQVVKAASPDNQAKKAARQKNTLTTAEKKDRHVRAVTICACGHSLSRHDSDQKCTTHQRRRVSICNCARMVPVMKVPSSNRFIRKVTDMEVDVRMVHPMYLGMFNLERTADFEDVEWLIGADCCLCPLPTVSFVYFDGSSRYSVPVCFDHCVLSSALVLTPDLRLEATERGVSEYVNIAQLNEPQGSLETVESKHVSFQNVIKARKAAANPRQKTVKDMAVSIGTQGLTYTADTDAAEVSNWIFDEVMGQTPENARYAITVDPRPQAFDSPEEFESANTVINKIRFDFGLALQAKCKERAPHLTVDQVLVNLFQMNRIPWRTVEG